MEHICPVNRAQRIPDTDRQLRIAISAEHKGRVHINAGGIAVRGGRRGCRGRAFGTSWHTTVNSMQTLDSGGELMAAQGARVRAGWMP